MVTDKDVRRFREQAAKMGVELSDEQIRERLERAREGLRERREKLREIYQSWGVAEPGAEHLTSVPAIVLPRRFGAERSREIAPPSPGSYGLMGAPSERIRSETPAISVMNTSPEPR